jgi:hypothetical protein
VAGKSGAASHNIQPSKLYLRVGQRAIVVDEGVRGSLLIATDSIVLRGLGFSNKVGVVEILRSYGDRGEERRAPCLSPG